MALSRAPGRPPGADGQGPRDSPAQLCPTSHCVSGETRNLSQRPKNGIFQEKNTPTFNLEIMLASASSLALFWCTSLLASIFA